jgi:hypothetical protein
MEVPIFFGRHRLARRLLAALLFWFWPLKDKPWISISIR